MEWASGRGLSYFEVLGVGIVVRVIEPGISLPLHHHRSPEHFGHISAPRSICTSLCLLNSSRVFHSHSVSSIFKSLQETAYITTLQYLAGPDQRRQLLQRYLLCINCIHVTTSTYFVFIRRIVFLPIAIDNVCAIQPKNERMFLSLFGGT